MSGSQLTCLFSLKALLVEAVREKEKGREEVAAEDELVAADRARTGTRGVGEG